MPLSYLTVLTPEQRERVAADPTVGGGNLLRSAIAANPHPELPFIHSHRPLINTEGQAQHEFSLLQLDQLAQSWSVWYLEQGVKPRDRVAVYLADSFAYSLHFYALSQIGAIPVLINSRAAQNIAVGLCRQTDTVGLYTDRERLAELGDEVKNLPALRWIQLTEELPAPPAADLPEEARFRHVDEDPVVILHSSGTTGRPKAVIHTHRSIAAGPKFRLVDHKEAPGALMMTGLPQSHLGCIAYTIYAVLGGTPIVALHDASGPQLHAAVVEYQPTAVMAFGHTYSELAAMELPPASVDSVNVWIAIGDAVHEPHIKKVLAQRSENLAPAYFYDRLGTTELGWGVLLKIRKLDSERDDRCVGESVGFADVTILRADGSLADDNEFGLLAARGPAITPGYWNDSDTTYRSKLAGYWLTGDVAYRDADGVYYQVDRAVDVIHTSTGPGYSVHMEELILSDVEKIAECAVVAGIYDGQRVPVALVKTLTDVDPQKLLEQANEVLSEAGHPTLALLEVEQTAANAPVGVTGKVLKRQLRDRYRDLSGYISDGRPGCGWSSLIASSQARPA